MILAVAFPTWLQFGSTLAAAAVFGVLAWSDMRLKALSGYGTADLQSFSTAAQYRAAFLVWPSRYAVRAGFDWGLDYLLMPLYAAAFFYSGILAREAFALRGSRLARILTTLLHEMKRSGAGKGLATLCVGGGRGVALTVEQV